MARRRRSKQEPILTLLFVLALAIMIPLLNKTGGFSSISSSFMLPYIIAAGVCISIAIIAIILWVEHRKLRALRALEIAAVDSMGGVEFERYVGSLLKSQGYHVQYTKASGDLGVDIVAKRKGQATAVQVKRYQSTLGQDAIRQAVAGMAFYHCDRSMVITNSSFTASAKLLASSNHCELINRVQLGEWIAAFQSR